MKTSRPFDELLKEMLDTHTKKGHDYARPGNPFSNFEFAAKLVSDFVDPVDRVFASIIGIKIARIIELQHKDAVNESVLDTHKDLTIYCGLWWWWKESKIKSHE
jgi:hypothetical protein